MLPSTTCVDKNQLIGGLANIQNWNALEDVKNLAVPLLVLAATNDSIVRPKDIEVSFFYAKGTTIEYIDHGGHSLPLSNPLWCSSKINDFIGKITGS